jgi:hypothetical protein
MPVNTEKRNQRQNTWIKENTDRINFTMPRGTKKKIQIVVDEIKTKTGDKKYSVAKWINEAIQEKLNKDIT